MSCLQLRNESLREIQTLNTYILDFSDTLWRYRAFNSMEQRSVYKEIDLVRLKEIQVSNRQLKVIFVSTEIRICRRK